MSITNVRSVVKRTAAALALAAALTAVTATVPASAAQSGPSLSGCQSTYAVLTATSGAQYAWNCSGAHYLSVRGSSFDAGGWSGAVYTHDRGAIFFCDFDHLTLNNADVYEVYLNATKPDRCK